MYRRAVDAVINEFVFTQISKNLLDLCQTSTVFIASTVFIKI